MRSCSSQLFKLKDNNIHVALINIISPIITNMILELFACISTIWTSRLWTWARSKRLSEVGTVTVMPLHYLGNTRAISYGFIFCMFVVVSQLLWKHVVWDSPHTVSAIWTLRQHCFCFSWCILVKGAQLRGLHRQLLKKSIHLWAIYISITPH